MHKPAQKQINRIMFYQVQNKRDFYELAKKFNL